MTFLANLIASARARGILGALGLMIALIVVVLLAGLLSRCVVGEKVEQAVALERADAVAEATNRVLDAERAATTNQMARDEAQRNEIQELKEIAREADNGSGVGPATVGVLERLRSQQAARGGASPAR